MPLVQIKDDEGQVVFTGGLNPRTYKTGTQGYFCVGKYQVGEKRYQVNFQVYEIGSKPGSKAAKPAAKGKSKKQ